MRCLFDKSEMEEIEERIKKGHAIILWGKDLELMTQLLQNPEPETHESWPRKINLAISEFLPEGSEPIGSFFLPGHWKHICDGLDVPTKVTTPEPGILLQDMTVNDMKAWRVGEKMVLTLWCSLLRIELMADFVHHDFGGDVDLAMLECKFDCSVPYINLHERPSILKTVESPNTVACIISFGLQLSFEIEGSDSTSPTLEDTLEMRRAWSEGKEAYLQIDW